MLKRLLLVVLVALIGISTASAQFNKAELNFLKTPFKITMNGDAIGSVRVDGKPNTYGLPSVKDFLAKFKSTEDKSTSAVSVTLVDIGARSIYDLCSNGVPAQIWQDPNTPANIHAVFVSSPPGDPSFAVRLAKYYLSTDFGVTWSFIADVPTVRAGFPTISGFSDGSALIASHTTDGGTVQRMEAYKDAAAGLGSFTRLDPGSTGYVWPRVVTTTNLTISNKFLMIGSQNPADTTAYSVCSNVGATPGTWTGYNKVTNADQAETYSLARGADGRIGLLYKNHDVAFDNDYGCVFFIESTNNGTTFTSALKIFQSNFTGTGDSLGSLRGLNLVYQGNTPKVVFETITLSKTTVGSYYPGLNANIRFWSTSLSGTDPNRSIVLADTNTVGYHPYFGVGDVMAPICRPSIGVSSDGNRLFCAFQVPSDIAGGTGADTTPYMNIYLTGSTNNGNTWFTPERLNPTTPRRDWRWVSVSKWNDMVGTSYYCNMVCNRDSVPGSYVNGTGNGESNSQYWSIRALVPFTAISNISSEVPANYSLSQNYPNPFNPTTNIKFAIVKSGFVSLKVYDLAGKEVASLVNEKLSTGTYGYSLNASNLSSGIYFYTLRTEGFTETKKMMLIK